MLTVWLKGELMGPMLEQPYTRDALATELTNILHKSGNLSNLNTFMSTLTDFQEIVLELKELDIAGIISDEELKNRFMEIVTLYISMLSNVNAILYKKNNHKLSLHIIAMRILNTVKGLDTQPRSITINNTKISMDNSMGSLIVLTTVLTHFIFKIQSNPIMVSDVYYEPSEAEQVMNSCTEIISVLIIIWNQYFDNELSVKTFIEELNTYLK